jgi:tetratricopeptide (TPR) repeat protein
MIQQFGLMTVNVHRLVQQVIRINLKDQNKEKEIVGEAFELLKNNFPHGGDHLEDYIKKRQLLVHLEALLSHMDDWVAKKTVDKERIEQDYLKYLLAWMIEGHFNLGDHRKARVLLERVLPIIERHGEKHFEFANALTNLGTIYGKLGNRDKAIDLLEKALNLKE